VSLRNNLDDSVVTSVSGFFKKSSSINLVVAQFIEPSIYLINQALLIFYFNALFGQYR